MKKVSVLTMFVVLAIGVNGASGANPVANKNLEQGIREFNSGYSINSIPEDKTTNCAVVSNAAIEKNVSEITITISIPTGQENINPMGYEFSAGAWAEHMNMGTHIFQEYKTWNFENYIAAICLPEGIKFAFADMAKLFVLG